MKNIQHTLDFKKYLKSLALSASVEELKLLAKLNPNDADLGFLSRGTGLPAVLNYSNDMELGQKIRRLCQVVDKNL